MTDEVVPFEGTVKFRNRMGSVQMLRLDTGVMLWMAAATFGIHIPFVDLEQKVHGHGHPMKHHIFGDVVFVDEFHQGESSR